MSSSRSSPFHTQTFLVLGNREQHGKARTDHVPGNRKQFTSHMDVDAHLSDKEVSTNALVKIDTKAIERIKIGSNKICIREDLAKEKMAFSQESSQTIFEMGNVELIELKTSMIQCSSCYTTFLKGQFFADQESSQTIFCKEYISNYRKWLRKQCTYTARISTRAMRTSMTQTTSTRMTRTPTRTSCTTSEHGTERAVSSSHLDVACHHT